MSKRRKALDLLDVGAKEDLPAGSFSTWLRNMRDTLRSNTGSDVPCGDCTACCTSSQFIHIAPDEADVLAQIPKALLFPAPGLPEGNVLMGYNTHGHCPMLIDNKCSIYAHRPQTCRNYDCRVFPAAGITPDEAEKALVAKRVKRWKFNYESARDETLHAAVKSAAIFLREHAECFPNGVPRNATQLAALAIKVHAVFLGGGTSESAERSNEEIANAIIRANAEFATNPQ